MVQVSTATCETIWERAFFPSDFPFPLLSFSNPYTFLLPIFDSIYFVLWNLYLASYFLSFSIMRRSSSCSFTHTPLSIHLSRMSTSPPFRVFCFPRILSFLLFSSGECFSSQSIFSCFLPLTSAHTRFILTFSLRTYVPPWTAAANTRNPCQPSTTPATVWIHGTNLLIRQAINSDNKFTYNQTVRGRILTLWFVA